VDEDHQASKTVHRGNRHQYPLTESQFFRWIAKNKNLFFHQKNEKTIREKNPENHDCGENYQHYFHFHLQEH